MIKRPLLISIFLFMIASAGYAQNFMQSVGLTGAVMGSTLRSPLGLSGRFGMTHIHANYYPRINLPITDYTSISAGIPFGLGLGFINNNFLNVKSTSISYDVPLAIDYNIGFKAMEEKEEELGFYLGLGFGYTGTVRDTLGLTGYKANSAGMLIRGGVRVAIDQFDSNNMGISIGFFHKIGMGIEKFRTSGINVMLDF